MRDRNRRNPPKGFDLPSGDRGRGTCKTCMREKIGLSTSGHMMSHKDPMTGSRCRGVGEPPFSPENFVPVEPSMGKILSSITMSDVNTWQSAAMQIESRAKRLLREADGIRVDSDYGGLYCKIVADALTSAANTLFLEVRYCNRESAEILDNPCRACFLPQDKHCPGCGGCPWSLVDGIRRDPASEHSNPSCALIKHG